MKNSQDTTTSALTDQAAAQKKLTNKQRIFVQHILENPQDSYTKAAQIAYPNQTYGSARVQAAENLTKPNIVMALGKANDIVESTLMNTVKEWGDHEKPRQREIAIDTAKYIHDKIHGKAKQQMEIRSESVSISIDLSGHSEPV